MAIPAKNILGNPNVTEGSFQIAIEQLRESVIGSGKAYDSANTYMINDTCVYGGIIYYSKVDNNIGNTPSIGANWGDYADLILGVVHKTGNETIAGILTFTSSPIVPTPTTGDSTTKVATTAFVNAEISEDVGVANSALVKTALNATGTAPIYACRAWVNFNGTGTVAIRASGNVSSITDNGVGDYTVNFTTAMTDANYATVAISKETAGGAPLSYLGLASNTTSAVSMHTVALIGGAFFDVQEYSVVIFR